MYVRKKRGFLVSIVIALIMFCLIIIAFKEGGITGAVISLSNETVLDENLIPDEQLIEQSELEISLPIIENQTEEIPVEEEVPSINETNLPLINENEEINISLPINQTIEGNLTEINDSNIILNESEELNFNLSIPNLILPVENITIINESLSNISNKTIVVNEIKIQALPVVSSAVLNSTNILVNDTDANLTLYYTASDSDGDAITNITIWSVNNVPITVLNMPFEKVNGTNNSNAYDYSGLNVNRNATVKNGVVWSSSRGFNGKGAYVFDGI